MTRGLAVLRRQGPEASPGELLRHKQWQRLQEGEPDRTEGDE